MKLVIDGFDQTVELNEGRAATLQIENCVLFSRLVRSLALQDEDCGLESFSLWEGEERVKAKDSLLVVTDLLNLPWDHRLLLGAVLKKMEGEFLEDEDMRQAVEASQQVIASKLLSIGMSYDSDYGYRVEWDFKRYLKMMAFGIDTHDDDSYIDNVIRFLSLAFDASCKQTIVFVNLKTFLSENELKSMFDHIFSTRLKVLLLENKCDNTRYENEEKYVVDLQFLES